MTPTEQSVTVVITTHDRGDDLLAAIESVRAQTHAQTEILVVDDGSNPPVVGLGPGVRLVTHQQSRGVCAARNSGVAAARGHYVFFLDDDDTLPEDALVNSLVAIACSALPPPVAALGTMAVIDDNGVVLEHKRPPTFQRGSGWLFDARPPGRTLTVQNTLLVPRHVVQEIGGWNEELKAWVHDDFFLRLTRACSLQGCDEVTYHLLQPRAGRDHVSRRLSARAASMERTLAAHQAAFDLHPRRQAKYLGTIAVTWLRVGDARKARTAAWRSMRMDPRRPKALGQLGLALGGARVYAAMSRARDRVSAWRSGLRTGSQRT